LEDDEDSCPDLLGPISSKGCPVVDTAIIQAVAKAAKHIYFLTGSYELSKSSYAHLDAISQIMLKNQGLKLLIEGHTDNVGTMDSNQKLSENRVVAVIAYLKATGVKEERLKFNAYGQSRPIESNALAKGREANRRVELSVSYSY
jgi:outer membrane protein OmpA-like peptidoglycan-associated protein